jgi:hypothetical protein
MTIEAIFTPTTNSAEISKSQGMTGISAHIRVRSENGNAIYLCSCTDVAHGKRRDRQERHGADPGERDELIALRYFVCVRIGVSLRPLLS